MVDCETSVRRLAIVGQGLPASSIAYDYKSLPPDGRRCRANSETDEGECGGLRMAGKHCQPKAFPLEGKVANAMSRMRCRLRSSRYLDKLKGNAAAAATTLTIRHSRFATLTLAKLVASLALHPPISATGSGGLRASSVRTSLTASPQGEAFWWPFSPTIINRRTRFPVPNHRPVAR